MRALPAAAWLAAARRRAGLASLRGCQLAPHRRALRAQGRPAGCGCGVARSRRAGRNASWRSPPTQLAARRFRQSGRGQATLCTIQRGQSTKCRGCASPPLGSPAAMGQGLAAPSPSACAHGAGKQHSSEQQVTMHITAAGSAAPRSPPKLRAHERSRCCLSRCCLARHGRGPPVACRRGRGDRHAASKRGGGACLGLVLSREEVLLR